MFDHFHPIHLHLDPIHSNNQIGVFFHLCKYRTLLTDLSDLYKICLPHYLSVISVSQVLHIHLVFALPHRLGFIEFVNRIYSQDQSILCIFLSYLVGLLNNVLTFSTFPNLTAYLNSSSIYLVYDCDNLSYFKSSFPIKSYLN